MEELTNAIDKILEILKSSKKAAFGAGRIVDDVQISELVTSIRLSLPVALKEAQLVLRDRENIVRSAEEEASRIIKNAQARANDILDNDKLIKQAQIEAGDIKQGARAEGEKIVKSAEGYIDSAFERAERALAEVLRELVHTRDDFMGKKPK